MLTPYVRAAFPALAIVTAEEERFTAELLHTFPEKSLLAISATGGLRDLRNHTVLDAAATFAKAFVAAAQRPDTLLLVFDWQHIGRNAAAYRSMKDQFNELKAHGSCILLVAPSWSLPAELQHDVPVLEWSLPTREQLKQVLHLVADSVGDTVTAEQEMKCLDAAAGLTLQEAENSFALALVECGKLEPARIEEEKMRLVRNSGFLEVWPAVAPESVGGLGCLKDYLASEVLPCHDDADLRVRGLLLVGIPGTGKSLAAKAAGALLDWPVLRMDIGALKGSLVGQSESNMRAALRLAEAVAPCVLWLDELEKGIGGYQSSAQTDSGVTLGMLGSLLTWQQEHRAPILTVATCNDHAKLPPELTRAGRFDQSFFVDLPTREEREQIASVHLARLGCAGALASNIADLSNGWTGAEIEQLVKASARRSGRQPTPDVLAACARDIRPISVVRAAETEALRNWARSALRIANTPEQPITTARRVSLGSEVSLGSDANLGTDTVIGKASLNSQNRA